MNEDRPNHPNHPNLESKLDALKAQAESTNVKVTLVPKSQKELRREHAEANRLKKQHRQRVKARKQQRRSRKRNRG